jgi:hypothetical protein
MVLAMVVVKFMDSDMDMDLVVHLVMVLVPQGQVIMVAQTE